jgi:hypothetical protein
MIEQSLSATFCVGWDCTESSLRTGQYTYKPVPFTTRRLHYCVPGLAIFPVMDFRNENETARGS